MIGFINYFLEKRLSYYCNISDLKKNSNFINTKIEAACLSSVHVLKTPILGYYNKHASQRKFAISCRF